ncbi:hypothetical protein Hanom_Chr01g00015741 [Helianthus anomalus]
MYHFSFVYLMYKMKEMTDTSLLILINFFINIYLYKIFKRLRHNLGIQLSIISLTFEDGVRYISILKTELSIISLTFEDGVSFRQTYNRTFSVTRGNLRCPLTFRR